MGYDSAATRERILAAASAEFAEHGVAGARVDRIAAAARSNKAQIYHYFGSKDGLFDAVFGAYAEAATDSSYFDADDLGETAGRIFDQYAASPELGRLTAWYRLERAGRPETIAAIADANAGKIAAIAAAQAAGRVTDRFPADVILALTLVLATSWIDVPPEFESIPRDHSLAERRAFTVAAVARLVAP